MKKAFSRLLSLFVVLSLLCSCALALTVDEARDLLETYYVDELPPAVLEQTTIEAMLQALGDPYTTYYNAKDYQAFLGLMEDVNIVGIGVAISMTEQGLLLEQVYAGGGAANAGLVPGDIVTAIDGRTTVGETLEAAGSRLRGGEGTTLTLTVARDGFTREYQLTRSVVVLPATTGELLDGHIGYLSCTTFGGQTYGHFAEEVEAMDASADRWIVDLRGNGGGSVVAAVDAVSVFADGDVAYLRSRDGRYQVYRTDKAPLVKEPVVVMIDGNTASSSEIFATAIREHGAGILVGERTYGKGVGQALLDETVLPDLFADGSALKVTTSRIFSTNGAATDTVGVIPELLVDPALSGEVTRLLSSSALEGDNTRFIRLDMTWRWYINVAQATTPESRAALAALLEAVPPMTELWIGTGLSDSWQSATPAEAAGHFQLEDYTSRSFPDVTGESTPYASSINTMATYGLLKGDGTGNYRPDGTLTRAEFCAMLTQAVGYLPTGAGADRYSDVPADKWYADDVAAISDAGLMGGFGDGRFYPDSLLSHQEVITVIARLAQRMNMYYHETLKTGPHSPLEGGIYEGYAPWARSGLWLLAESQDDTFGQTVNLLWDEPSTIDPAANTTRGEAAAALYTVLYYGMILPA